MSKNKELIDEFLDYKDNIVKCSKHTIRAYKNDLIQYLGFLSKHKIKLLDSKTDDVQLYLNIIGKKNIATTSMARKLASVRSLYKYLSNNKIISVNVTKTIKSPKLPKRLPNFLSAKEVKSLLDYPYGNSTKDVRDRLILELFYCTGVRISELAGIRIKDIDFFDKLIKIKGKGNKERFVIFGDSMVSILNEYINKRDIDKKNNKSTFLFPGYSNNINLDTHISTRTIFSIVKKYIKKISNNEKLSPHSIRHSFATHLLDNGANIVSVKELMGHSSLSSTQIYTHVKIEKLKEEYKKSHPHGDKGEKTR